MFKDKSKLELKEALEVAECACKLYPEECHIEKTGNRECDWKLVYVSK
jgi:hypothetical protein